mmetsp:Transcript_12405/g.57409  ORF Transcript_12405/g.57409 Transcript_12405/m.57409 type:complete len:268 (-) Transcript_12405:3233-4036(-)
MRSPGWSRPWSRPGPWTVRAPRYSPTSGRWRDARRRLEPTVAWAPCLGPPGPRVQRARWEGSPFRRPALVSGGVLAKGTATSSSCWGTLRITYRTAKPSRVCRFEGMTPIDRVSRSRQSQRSGLRRSQNHRPKFQNQRPRLRNQRPKLRNHRPRLPKRANRLSFSATTTLTTLTSRRLPRRSNSPSPTNGRRLPLPLRRLSPPVTRSVRRTLRRSARLSRSAWRASRRRDALSTRGRLNLSDGPPTIPSRWWRRCAKPRRASPTCVH